MRRRTLYALLALIFVLGFALRWRHLSKVPAQNDTVDEFAWTWSGMTLVDEGVPRAWSFLTPYHQPKWHYWHGYNFPMVEPWLDHPPLFSLVMAGWMRLGGFHDLYRVDLHYMRCMSVWLFVAAFWLLALLLPRYFDPPVLLLGMLAFATAPLATINQRLVVSENFLTVLFLGGLLCLHHVDSRRRGVRVALLLTLLLIGAALPFSKLAAVSLTAGLMLWAALAGEWLAVAALTVGTALGLYAFVLYGTHFDAALFWAVLRAHRDRFLGFGGAFQLATNWELVSTPFRYYPFLLGLVGVIEGLREERTRPFFAPYLAYLGVMVFLVDQGQVWGWYFIPLLPLVSLGLGLFTYRMLVDGSGARLLVWALFCVPYMAQVFFDHFTEHQELLRYGYVVVFGGFAGVLVWCTRRPGERTARLARTAAMVALTALTVTDVAYLIWRWPLSHKTAATASAAKPTASPTPTPTPSPSPNPGPIASPHRP